MLKITPTRAALLRLLTQHPSGCMVSMLACHIAPRQSIGGQPLAWSAQGAARWGGGYVKPLEEAGLITVNRYVQAGVGMAAITPAGKAALKQYDTEARA